MSLNEIAVLRKSTFRSHPASVSCCQFHPSQPWLISGDEAGWCFWWSTISRRPIAIWRSHLKAVVAVKWISSWNGDNDNHILLTHGRDNKIKVYQLDTNTDQYTTKIPNILDNDKSSSWKIPWMLHSQDVNALNFCSVAVCGPTIAIPNTLSSEKIDIYELRPQFIRRFFAIEGSPNKTPTASNQFSTVGGFDQFSIDESPSEARSQTGTGIVMALLLTPTRLVAGYESGHVFIFDITCNPPTQIYCNNTHKHPVLSLALHPTDGTFISSSADSLLVKHSLINPLQGDCLQMINTKHAGLASLDIRSDGRIFAIAGWDGMVRIYTYKTMKPLAVFKGSEDRITDKTGITCIAFSPVSKTELEGTELIDNDVKKDSRLITASNLALARQLKARQIHWLAVAGKDGRIRLSNIY